VIFLKIILYKTTQYFFYLYFKDNFRVKIFIYYLLKLTNSKGFFKKNNFHFRWKGLELLRLMEKHKNVVISLAEASRCVSFSGRSDNDNFVCVGSNTWNEFNGKEKYC